MLTSLHIRRFKSFKKADIRLGPLTILIGANSSGKSNLRDAFRFLHGISRGYSVAEILGQKYGEEGTLQWRGIRGGIREVAFDDSETFTVNAVVKFSPKPGRKPWSLVYQIKVAIDKGGRPPCIVAESLKSVNDYLFFEGTTHDKLHLKVQYNRGRRKGRYPPSKTYINTTPILHQLADDPEVLTMSVKTFAKGVLESLRSFRFLDLSPGAMRIPSYPGQTVLGDRGENLSSVLYSICQTESMKKTLVEWIKELTPMDASDFEFPADQTGRVLVTLVEENGRRTSAYSASDGTLRFLAMIAALLGPEPAKLYFFEELDNGIHPTRLSLLLQLIERQVANGDIQMIATTHSPQLLGYLSEQALGNAFLTYRLPGKPEARIRRILDIPEARKVLERQDISRLHASGWLENAVAFLEGGE